MSCNNSENVQAIHFNMVTGCLFVCLLVTDFLPNNTNNDNKKKQKEQNDYNRSYSFFVTI